LTSDFNFLETHFKIVLIRLLKCLNYEVAYTVAEERRSFQSLIELVEKLYALYDNDEESRKQLSKIVAVAKTLNDERNKYVHSMWFGPLDPEQAITRVKGSKVEQIPIAAITEIAEEMAKCSMALTAFERSKPSVFYGLGETPFPNKCK
jgi:hypothetical protein